MAIDNEARLRVRQKCLRKLLGMLVMVGWKGSIKDLDPWWSIISGSEWQMMDESLIAYRLEMAVGKRQLSNDGEMLAYDKNTNVKPQILTVSITFRR